MSHPLAARAVRLAVVLALAATASAQIVFEPPVVKPLAHATQAVITADVDADGDLDLIALPRFVGGFVVPQLSVLMGHGNDSFGAPIVTTLPTVDCGRGCALDLDGDPFPDLALGFVTSGANGVTLMHGNGDGTFDVGSSFTLAGGFIGGKVNDVLPVDLTHDGLLDLVVVEGGTVFAGRVSTLVAVGVGRFEVHLGTPIPSSSLHGAVGDVDGDGQFDVVVSNSTMGTLSLQRGVGNGSFGPTETLSVGGSPRGLVLADFGADGALDIALADSTGNRVLVLAGDGDGGFTTQQILAVGLAPEFLSAGPLDGDGALDLLVSDFGSDELSVLRGAGDGSFALVATVSHVPLAAGSALGDFDADGVLDAAVASESPTVLAPTDAIAVLRNHTYAAGSPFTDLGHAFPGANGYAIHLADGTLAAGTPVSFKLLNALPGGHSTLFLGFSQANLPFKGGTLVPFPDLVYTPFPISGAGSTTLSATWPGSVPSGFAFYLQFGFKDAGALNGYAISNAVRVVTP